MVTNSYAKIAIGARSAIFAPLQNGLVVIDEEHDQSCKQGESPRYQGRDVAVYRAFQEKTTVILGLQLRLLNHGKTVGQESTIC